MLFLTTNMNLSCLVLSGVVCPVGIVQIVNLCLVWLQHGPLQNIPHEVVLWTNHRVMEWLRTIDLSEYAPNLRGSGVHGGLMVRDARTAEIELCEPVQ